MVDLSTKYLGLHLKNPIIAGSCGLTGGLDDIKALAAAGAGAIVLKSLFEEQIMAELAANLESYQADYPDAYAYVREYTRGDIVGSYLQLIRAAKEAVDIPIIASINCVSANEWTSFASSVEKSGADAIEINVSLLPCDPRRGSDAHEKIYFDVMEQVGAKVKIPIALKMSMYSSSLANLIARLSWTKRVAGFVLFNRYASPDISIEQEKVVPAAVFSSPEEITLPLRWIALLSGEISSDFVASTGVHDSAGVIKQLLAGATAVQTVSALYQHGPDRIGEMHDGLVQWMETKGYEDLAAFRGRLRYDRNDHPAIYERIQFMKQFGGIR